MDKTTRTQVTHKHRHTHGAQVAHLDTRTAQAPKLGEDAGGRVRSRTMTAPRSLWSSGHYAAPAPCAPHSRQKHAQHRRPPWSTAHTRTHTLPSELTYTVNEFVPPRVKFLPKAAPLYRALLPFAQTRHFLSAPPVGAHILLGASLRARHRWFLF